MEELTLRLSKKILLELLRQIPTRELQELINEAQGKRRLELVRVGAQSLDKLIGIISLGGDALHDTESIYE